MTRRVRIELAYDGTDFAGWQVQPTRRTVQGELQRALARLAGDRAVYARGAGRTDAGVHARDQVADAVLASPLDDAGLAHALARMLPGDVRVGGVTTVDEAFHARRDARSKTYAYRLDRSRGGDPFAGRFALHAPWPLDRDALADALGRLPGRRDWTGFAGSAGVVRDPVRRLFEARLEADEARGVWWFVFRGEGFLNYMARNLVGTLLAIGRGRMEPERVDRVLASGDRSLAGPTAPPRGLCLLHVDYDGRPGRPGGFPGP